MPPSRIRPVNRRMLVGVGRAAMAMSQERPWNAPRLIRVNGKRVSKTSKLKVEIVGEENP